MKRAPCTRARAIPIQNVMRSSIRAPFPPRADLTRGAGRRCRPPRLHPIRPEYLRLSKICPPRGHPRGRFRSSGSQHPLPLPLPLPRSRHRSCRNPLAPLRFARMLANPLSDFGREWGWERPPSERRTYSPAIRTYASPFATCRGSLPARACGASDPCGKASNPPVAGGGSGRGCRRPWSLMRSGCPPSLCRPRN